MSPTDLPRHVRSLGPGADVPRGQEPDSAGAPREYSPDGAARKPAELLDQLRQRLDRLADNHPSAPRESARASRTDGLPGLDDSPGAPDSLRPDGSGERGDDQADRVRDAQEAPALDGEDARAPRGPDDGPGEHESADGDEAPADEGARDPGRSGRPTTATGESDLGDVSLGLPGQSEIYRPWFMSGESATPWFAAGQGR